MLVCQSGDSSSVALDETKRFATQSLASVAYQINAVAGSILRLLDAQSEQLRHMESSITLIGQVSGAERPRPLGGWSPTSERPAASVLQKLEMHREKVSRREIGAFTVVKHVPRSHKILPLSSPSSSQPRPPYSRRPINYRQLDGVGHGVKVRLLLLPQPLALQRQEASTAR